MSIKKKYKGYMIFCTDCNDFERLIKEYYIVVTCSKCPYLRCPLEIRKIKKR